MNKLFFLIAFCIGCGGTFTGIEYTSAEPIDEDMFYRSIETVELYYKRMFNDNFDIYESLDKYPVLVSYQPVVEDSDSESNTIGRFLWGNPSTIEIEQVDNCIQNYYTLAHEMLHWLVNVESLASNQENDNHHVPGLFMWWWLDEENPPESTLEWWLSINIRYTCENNQDGLDSLQNLLDEVYPQ